jgi:murein tripeptide amidase MpaA
MPITIHADFDGGNIEVLGSEGGRFDLAIRPDTNAHFYQWFYFRVDGAANTPLELRLTNAAGSAYPDGWPGYAARVSADNTDWTCAETTYADGVLTIRHTPSTGSVWFAYFAPYSSERHKALVQLHAAMAGVRHDVLGRTLDGRPLDRLRFGSGELQVWLYARQHPGETMAEWWMEGALTWLVSPQAAGLLEAATVHVIPNMNPDGSARGHLRTNAAGVDLNREWAGPTAGRSPEVLCVLEAMADSGVDFALDVHGDEAIPHVFIAGFEGIPSLNDRQSVLYRIYTESLDLKTPDFQRSHGYPVPAPGKANLAMSTSAVAERFGAVAMTLEMPFKDHLDAPDPVRGWSPERSRKLAEDCLATLSGMLEDFTGR